MGKWWGNGKSKGNMWEKKDNKNKISKWGEGVLVKNEIKGREDMFSGEKRNMDNENGGVKRKIGVEIEYLRGSESV